MEEALQQAERQRRLIESSRDPICIWELDGGIIEWSRGSQELYGYARDEALGKRKGHLLATTVPSSSLDGVKATLLNTGVWSGALCQTSKSGQTLTLESVLQLQAIDGQQLVLETCHPVERKKM